MNEHAIYMKISTTLLVGCIFCALILLWTNRWLFYMKVYFWYTISEDSRKRDKYLNCLSLCLLAIGIILLMFLLLNGNDNPYFTFPIVLLLPRIFFVMKLTVMKSGLVENWRIWKRESKIIYINR